MTVGDRIRARRTELGMKADALAEKLGVSRATIYRYEGGGVDNLPAEFILPLAEALRTTPQYLLGVTDNEHATAKAKCLAIAESFTEEEAEAFLSFYQALHNRH